MKFLGLLTLAVLMNLAFIAYADDGEDEVASVASCYVCNELTDPSCGDVYSGKSSHLQQCENGEKYCRKIIQYVKGVESVVRGCAKETHRGITDGCYKSAGKSTQHICTCKPEAGSGDSCNDATRVINKPSVFLVGLIALIGAYLF